jgi:hypothetical protein
MELEQINFRSIENELEGKITSYNKKLSSYDFGSDKVKQFFQDLVFDTKNLYSLLLNVKNSYTFDTEQYSYNSAKILFLKDVKMELFNNLQIISSKLNLPTNLVINILMKGFLSIENEKKNNEIDLSQFKQTIKRLVTKVKATITVSNKEFIEVTNIDLEDPEIIFNFKNNEIVIFKDINTYNFIESVGRINNCKTVFIPNAIPKLVIYSKIEIVESIQIYNSLEDVYNSVLIFN